MAKIIINEHQEEILLNLALQESYNQDYSAKVFRVKNYLDKNFMRGSIPQMDDNDMPSKQEVVIMLDGDGKPVKTMSDRQLFELLQDKFKDILPQEERDEWLKRVIISWYKKGISKDGTLSQ